MLGWPQARRLLAGFLCASAVFGLASWLVTGEALFITWVRDLALYGHTLDTVQPDLSSLAGISLSVKMENKIAVGHGTQPPRHLWGSIQRLLIWLVVLSVWEGAYRVVGWKSYVFPAPSHIVGSGTRGSPAIGREIRRRVISRTTRSPKFCAATSSSRITAIGRTR